MNHVRLLLLVLTSLLAAAAPASSSAASAALREGHDRWYVLEMQGGRAGWVHDEQSVDNGRIISRSEMKLEMKRSSTELSISYLSEFVETVDGKPVSMKLISKTGAIPQTDEYTFESDHVKLKSSQGGQTNSTELPRPEGVWLTPAAAAQFVEKRLAAGAHEVEVRSIDPMSGLEPVLTRRRIIERTQVDALGKVVPAIKWVASNDKYPGVESVEFVDERGVTIRTEVKMGEISVVTVLADRDLALSKLNPPELMVSTLVKPDRPLDNPRKLRRASFLLSVPDGVMGDLPTQGGQVVTGVNARTARVDVDVSRRGVAPESEVQDPAFVEHSAMISSEDPEVVKLVDRALGRTSETTTSSTRAGKHQTGGAAGATAERLRRFVHAFIEEKHLGVGFASAAEVARTRAGDCSEHGVLLAALLRQAGIPARVVSGLVYADQFEGAKEIFGYHMWSQALLTVDGQSRWVDLDATLPDETPFDATHIALSVSPLSDGEGDNAMVTLAPLLGRLQIKVEKTE